MPIWKMLLGIWSTEELRLQSWGVGNAKERLHGCRFENKIWKQICWAWHKFEKLK